MRIAFLTEIYSPIKNGVVHAVQLSRDELRRRGHDVAIIAPLTPGIRTGDHAVYSVPAVPLPGNTGYTLPVPQLSGLSRVLSSVDIIHTHHPFSLGMWGQRVARKFNKPLIFTNHTQYHQYTHYVPLIGSAIQPGLAHHLQRFVAGCTLVIAPAPLTAQQLKAMNHTTPVAHVPNGIDTVRFARGNGQAIRIRLGLDQRTPLILYVGRLSAEKNVRFLVETVMSMPERPQLALVGNGPERTSLETMIERRRAHDHIHILGDLSYQQMPDAYDAATVFATTSTSEVHPLVILEAMAAGVPVVAFRAQGTADVIDDHVTGLLTEHTATAFTRGLRTFLEQEHLRAQCGAQAQAVAHSQYSIDASVTKLLDTYALARRLASTYDA